MQIDKYSEFPSRGKSNSTSPFPTFYRSEQVQGAEVLNAKAGKDIECVMDEHPERPAL